MTRAICNPNRVKRVSLWVWRQERQARQAPRRCRRDRREVIATSRTQKAPSHQVIGIGPSRLRPAVELEPEPESSLWVWRMSCSNVIYESGIAGRVWRTLPTAYYTKVQRLLGLDCHERTLRLRVSPYGVSQYLRPIAHSLPSRSSPSTVMLTMCGSAAGKGSVSLKITWWRHFFHAVPMPSGRRKGLSLIVTIW